jgi:hypothetical protein
MPANIEKQPRWLMSCKCGATVKAGECAVGITRFQLNEIRPYGAMRTRQAGNLPPK